MILYIKKMRGEPGLILISQPKESLKPICCLCLLTKSPDYIHDDIIYYKRNGNLLVGYDQTSWMEDPDHWFSGKT